jgi:NADH-quinone oxidoreductase subunit G
MIKLVIDQHEIEVDENTSILEAARKLGPQFSPPAMCYYKPLKESGGKCRTCLVKVTKGSDKDPRPMPKLVASCRTLVQEGMVVENFISEEVTQARKGVVEKLLINHPLDCPVCDQAGECKLQDLAFTHGGEKTRYEEERRQFPVQDIGAFIKLHMNRCILCYRCVYTADQLSESRCHGVLGRGDASEIGTYIQKSVDHEFSGNIIDVCPVGALTDKTFRFKSRVWFTKPFWAHRNCDKCSAKVVLWMKGEEVLRVSARQNEFGEVVEFICNECRFHRKQLSDWTLERTAPIQSYSVISQNLYASSSAKALPDG